jgi:hypothetical protein
VGTGAILWLGASRAPAVAVAPVLGPGGGMLDLVGRF